MTGYKRFAIYYLPEDPALAHFGARWLGWDVATAMATDQFDVDGIAEITQTPRKYGFHGTLKPPFYLSDGSNYNDFSKAASAFAKATPPVVVDAMKPDRIGNFLALTPVGDTSALADFAFDIVQQFDPFRAPATEAEFARRRAAGLTKRQDELLMMWGYPYVADEFRFHLTLTGKLKDADIARASQALDQLLPPLPKPFVIRSISIAGETEHGTFKLIERHTLQGE